MTWKDIEAERDFYREKHMETCKAVDERDMEIAHLRSVLRYIRSDAAGLSSTLARRITQRVNEALEATPVRREEKDG